MYRFMLRLLVAIITFLLGLAATFILGAVLARAGFSHQASPSGLGEPVSCCWAAKRKAVLQNCNVSRPAHATPFQQEPSR